MNKLILQNRYNFFLFIIILTLYYQKLYSQNFWQELPIPTAQLDEIKAISISSIGNILVGTFNFGNGKLYQSSDNGDS